MHTPFPSILRHELCQEHLGELKLSTLTGWSVSQQMEDVMLIMKNLR